MSDRAARAVGSVLVAIATAIVIVALAIVPFLSPAWIGFEQGRAQAADRTRFTPAELRTATDAIVADLVFGPPDFDVAVGGEPVLTEAERGHMRDVRGVFAGFAIAAVVAVVVLLVAARATGGSVAFRRAVRSGAVGLAVAILAIGAVALTGFDAAFEVFHRLFFAGNYTFDPATDRLVQLFPQRFWFETALAVGAAIVVLAGATAWLAGRRLAPAGSAAAVRTRPIEVRR